MELLTGCLSWLAKHGCTDGICADERKLIQGVIVGPIIDVHKALSLYYKVYIYHDAIMMCNF